MEVVTLQEDSPRQHPAVHGLHDQAQLCHHHAVVRRQQPLPPSARHGNQVWHHASHRRGQTDVSGDGVRLAPLLAVWSPWQSFDPFRAVFPVTFTQRTSSIEISSQTVSFYFESGPSGAALGVQFSPCHLPGIHCSVILNSARHFSPRGLDGEDRRLWFGHGESSVERLQTGGTAQWIHPVDGKHCSTSEGPCFCVSVNQGWLINSAWRTTWGFRAWWN